MVRSLIHALLDAPAPGTARRSIGSARSARAPRRVTSQRSMGSAAGRMPRTVRRTPWRGARCDQRRRNEQAGVVDALRRAAGDALTNGHRDEPAEPGRVDGVQHERPTGPEDTARLTDHSGRIGDVLENLAGTHRVGRLVGQGNGVNVGAYRDHAVLASRFAATSPPDRPRHAGSQDRARAARAGRHRSPGRPAPRRA